MATAPRGSSLGAEAWRRLRQNRMAVLCLWILFAILLLCVAGPWLSPYAPDAQDLAYGPHGPTLAHPFGTDLHGRDLLVRCMFGGRLSLSLGLSATAVALAVGVVYGAVSGYAGGWVDGLLMRAVDVLYVLPYMFVVILLLAAFGRSVGLLFLALGLVSWLTMARIVRGQILSLKHAEYVDAARVAGVGPAGILFRHLVPNSLGPIVVYATLTVPSLMLQEAFLSFLGLGVQPPAASWGLLVADGAQSLTFYPHLLIFPGALLGLTLFSLNFLGDGLRDALDPRMRVR